MEKVKCVMWVKGDLAGALYKAMVKTGKTKEQVFREALEDWLILYGFLEDGEV